MTSGLAPSTIVWVLLYAIIQRQKTLMIKWLANSDLTELHKASHLRYANQRVCVNDETNRGRQQTPT